MGDFPLDLDQLKQVLDYLNDGVYLADPDRRILLWNRRAEEITGWKAEQVVGQRCRDGILVHQDAHGQTLCRSDLCPMAQAMRTERPSKEPVLVYAQRADGRRIPVSVSVAPLRGDDGDIVGAIEVFRDESSSLQDLEFARLVQRQVLPDELPGTESLSFEVGYYPHDLVGGDFYWVRELEPGVLGLLVADVRGHGVSAALYTMTISSHLSTLAALTAEPGRLMGALNEHLEELTVAESFASAVYCLLDTVSWEVRYSNAGHPAPLLLDEETGEVHRLESQGPFLGMFVPQEYEESTVALPRRGSLLLYSDGAVEVTNRDDEEFGIDGLSRYLRELGTEPGLPERFYHYLNRYNAELSLPDDVLILVARLDRS